MSEPIDILVKAVVSRWFNAGTLSEVAGPYQGTEAPTSKASIMPRCTFTASGRMVRQTSAAEYYEISILFKLFDTTPENCATRASTLRDTFDPDSLITAGTMTLTDGHILSSTARGTTRYVQEDKNVWRAEIPYEFYTRKPRI